MRQFPGDGVPAQVRIDDFPCDEPDMLSRGLVSGQKGFYAFYCGINVRLVEFAFPYCDDAPAD